MLVAFLFQMSMRIGRLDRAQQKIAHGFAWIAFAAGNHPDAALGQFCDEALACTCRQDYIHIVQRMLVAGEFMKGHFQRKIEPHHFRVIARRTDIENDEAAALSGMPGHAPEILAGNGNFHDGLLLNGKPYIQHRVNPHSG
jgi:hypothetical protein